MLCGRNESLAFDKADQIAKCKSRGRMFQVTRGEKLIAESAKHLAIDGDVDNGETQENTPPIAC